MAEQVWLVDYDLPEGYPRVKFYREIRRWLKERGRPTTKWSTQSVIITRDEDFAWFAYDTAVSIGQAHIYRAEQVK